METLTTMNKETIEGLKDLVKINIDSAKGYETSAEAIEDQNLAQFFRACAARRNEFAEQLRTKLEMSNEEASDTSSLKATAHRWWIKAKAALQSGDRHGVLAEAERGEDAIKACYEEVIKETTGSPVNDLLHQQYADVKATHDTVRDMRDRAA